MSRRINTVTVFAALLAVLCGPARGDNDIDVSCVRDWTIVVARDASLAERYAAEEFQRFFQEATGVEISVGSRRAHGRVYIGSSDALRRSRIGFDTAGFGEEEFRIRVGHDAIAIAGGRPRGTLYGVYQFLEDYLGVRFLTADHTEVPHNPELKLPYIDIRRAPLFEYRWSYCKEASAFPEFAARLRLNTLTPDERYGGVTREKMESHTLFYQVPVERYGKEHPEYFAWVDGRRMLEAPGGGPQVCPLNPDVADIVTKAVLDDLAAHPDQGNVCVSMNDNPFYCMCPECAAVNEREGSPAGAHLTLVNAVAERVERAHPGVKVATLAYWYTQKPPKSLRARSNVRVWFCPFTACALHRLDDPACPRNAPLLKDLDGWRATCDDVRIWYYNTDLRTLDLPYLNLRSLGPNLRLFKQRGLRGAFVQADDKCFAGEFADLRNYVTSRLLWNPDLDGDAVREEFLRLHYGPAAEPIRACIEMLHDRAERGGAHPYCWIDPSGSGIDAEGASSMRELFEQALALAPDDVIRARIEKASLGLYKAAFETQGHLAYDAGRVRLEYPAGVLDLVPRYRGLCEKFGMTFDSELGSRDGFLDSMRNMVKGARAARIENGVWRVTLLPDLGGEVVELFHKPSRRQLLDAWDHPNINLPRGTWGWRFADNAPLPKSFEYAVHDRSVAVLVHFEDGSTGESIIRLRGSAVEFEAAVRHRGAAPRLYRYTAGIGLVTSAQAVSPSFLPKASRSHSLSGVYGIETCPAFVVEIESGQLNLPKVELEPGLPGMRLDISSPNFSLRQGGQWRARYRIELGDETTH